MNKRLLSVVAFALVVSGVASLIIYRLIAARLTASAARPSSMVVVASRNLEVGTLVKDLDLKTVEWTGLPPKGALNRADDVIGRGVVANVYEGEPILENRIAAKGAGAGLAATIPPGMRAVAVRVNEVVGVGGFVTPGMRVDVLIAGNPPGTTSSNLGTLSKTLLQNVEVLSAGQNIAKDAEGKPVTVPVVTLLVTPGDAEILSLASNETRIQLILRNPLDTEVTKTSGTAIAHLFSGNSGPITSEKPAAPRPARPRPQAQPNLLVPVSMPDTVARERVVIPITVEVIHGSRKSEFKFKQQEAAQPSEASQPKTEAKK